MNRIEAAARDIAARAQTAAIDRTAAAIQDAVPDATVSAEPGRVLVEGRGLARRWAMSAALRWIGSLLR